MWSRQSLAVAHAHVRQWWPNCTGLEITGFGPQRLVPVLITEKQGLWAPPIWCFYYLITVPAGDISQSQPKELSILCLFNIATFCMNLHTPVLRKSSHTHIREWGQKLLLALATLKFLMHMYVIGKNLKERRDHVCLRVAIRNVSIHHSYILRVPVMCTTCWIKK